MKKTRILAVVMLPLVALGGSGLARAAVGETVDNLVTIAADGANSVAGSVYVADDHVVCHFKGDTLTADHLTYNSLTHTIVASGHVKVLDHGNTIAGPRITVLDCSIPSPRYIVTSGRTPVVIPSEVDK